MKSSFRYRRTRIVVAAFIFSIMCFSFLWSHDLAAMIFQFQFAPALARVALAFSIPALLIILALSAITILFGRVYCAALCPLGIAQDIIDAPVPRKSPTTLPNPRRLRYLIAAIVFTLLFGGYAVGLRVLDPYSIFGAALGGSSELIARYGTDASTNADDLRVVTWVLPIAILIAMVIWKRRLFCTSLCPVGAILGIMSRYAVYRLGFAGVCVGCGRCVLTCPVDCISVESRKIDNERCVRCMNCMAACPKGAISFSRHHHDRTLGSEARPDSGRRDFLIRSTAAALGVVAVGCGARIVLPQHTPSLDEQAQRILPPGASSIVEFSQRCTHCLLCVSACPAKIIKPSSSRYGHVYMDLNKGQCQYECVRCSQVCPTGAIQTLTLEQKQRTRIGSASYNPRNCRVLHQDIECGLCAKNCPNKAVSLRFLVTGLAIPELDTAKCIGCGACQSACPVTPKAMVIQPIA